MKRRREPCDLRKRRQTELNNTPTANTIINNFGVICLTVTA